MWIYAAKKNDDNDGGNPDIVMTIEDGSRGSIAKRSDGNSKSNNEKLLY